MFSRQWWRDATERMAKTMIQALSGFVVGGAFNVWTIDWKLAASVVLGGALLSLATSVASWPFGAADSASMVDG
jgi:hypothetical protein